MLRRTADLKLILTKPRFPPFTPPESLGPCFVECHLKLHNNQPLGEKVEQRQGGPVCVAAWRGEDFLTDRGDNVDVSL